MSVALSMIGRPPARQRTIDTWFWGRKALKIANTDEHTFESWVDFWGAHIAGEMLLLAVARVCKNDATLWSTAKASGIPWQRKTWSGLLQLQDQYNDAVENNRPPRMEQDWVMEGAALSGSPSGSETGFGPPVPKAGRHTVAASSGGAALSSSPGAAAQAFPPATLEMPLRPSHKHPRYGDGLHGQTPVACLTPVRGTASPCHGLHAVLDWNNCPFLTEHAFGLQLHDKNVIQMDDNKLISMNATFNMTGRLGHLWERLQHQIATTEAHFVWFQMACHKSKYRAWMVKCKCCGRLAWAASTPVSSEAFVDHEVADLVSFFNYRIPNLVSRPLENRLPMV